MEALLSHLPRINKKNKKRLGRGAGSGRGAKSGRGTTRHQKAREKIPLHFEGGQGRAIKSYPLLRGKGKNKSVRPKPYVIKASRLAVFKAGETVTLESLVEKKLVDRSALKRGVKIVSGRTPFTKRLILKVPASKSARSQSEKEKGE